jgi:hypothetical protein
MSYTAKNFYESELERLKDKNANATTILSSKERVALLNDSYRKRYSKYVEILVILIVAFLIYLGVAAIQTAFPIIPSVAVDILAAILIAGVLYYVVNIWFELYTRSQLNYDELDLPAYNASEEIDAATLAAKKGILSGKGNTCVGQACCPAGFTWDQETNKCKTSPASTTTPSTTSTSSSTTPVASFTTMELESIQTAYTHTAFDSPSLQRKPVSGNVNAVVDVTSLAFSNV